MPWLQTGYRLANLVTGSDRLRQAPTGSDRLRQAPTGSDRLQQAPTGPDGLRQAPTGSDRLPTPNSADLGMWHCSECPMPKPAEFGVRVLGEDE